MDYNKLCKKCRKILAKTDEVCDKCLDIMAEDMASDIWDSMKWYVYGVGAVAFLLGLVIGMNI